MLGLLTRCRRRPPATRPHSVRLALEALERRDLLAAPSITGFTATTLVGHVARLSGTVTDENPATVRITFSGAVSGSTTVDATGHFSFSTTNAVLGSVTATGLDQENLSATATSTLSSSAPVITNFKAIMGSFGFWTFTGKVIDEDPSHCTVKFSGLPELEGKTTTVAADGTFTYTVQLKPGETGMVLATATDCWGLTSQEAEAIVS